MKVYIHKVLTSSQDGWGRCNGQNVEILGIFQEKKNALHDKNKRDKIPGATHCDMGKSWIEEYILKDTRD